MTVFYDEHVKADAVHEQIAAVNMCRSLVAEELDLVPGVLFGAACSLAMDAVAAGQLLGAWVGRSVWSGNGGGTLSPSATAAAGRSSTQ